MQSASMASGEAWRDFFTTAAGASATLVGLVIVAISVNIQRILEHPQLPSRGGATVGALVLILVSSMAELIPQAISSLAIEICVLGFVVWLLQLWSARHTAIAYLESRLPLHTAAIGIAIGQLQAIPFMIVGIFLLTRQPAGPYLIAGAILATFILSVVNIWVLLVEILR
jgi:hypothetical protein